MEEQKDSKEVQDPAGSKGFGSGMILGMVVGIGLFLLTVQILYIAK